MLCAVRSGSSQAGGGAGGGEPSARGEVRAAEDESPLGGAEQEGASALPTDWGERLEICASCEHSEQSAGGLVEFCAECGCMIAAKAFFETFHCPIERW